MNTVSPIRVPPADRPRTDWVAFPFVAFFTLPFLVFNIAPILFGAFLSFTKWGIFGKPKWVGWQNYIDAFNDDFVRISFRNTLLYAGIIVPSVVVLGLTFAIYVNQRWPLAGLVRTLFFSPYVVSATVIGLVWVWILDTQYGVVNNTLKMFGIGAIPWLTSMDWSLVGVSIASIWWDLGLAFILFLAALQEVPRDLYDAAEVDGASIWQRLWYVTLPQLRPVISMVITLQLIASLRIFSQVYVMTNGGPASSSSSVIYVIYSTAINRQLFGYSAAVSMLLFAMILAITLLQRFLIKER